MTTGQKIQYLRKKHMITQEDLAEKLQISRQSISRWEQDLSYPETDKILLLAKVFNVTTDYLLKDEEDTLSIDDSKKYLLNYKSASIIYIFSIIFIYVISAILYALYYQYAHIAIKILSYIIYTTGNFAVIICYILSRKKYLFNVNYTENEKIELYKGTRNFYIPLILSIISFVPISIAVKPYGSYNILYFDLYDYLGMLIYTIPIGLLISYLTTIFHKMLINLIKINLSGICITINIISAFFPVIITGAVLDFNAPDNFVIIEITTFILLFNFITLIIFQIIKYRNKKISFIILQISQILLCIFMLLKMLSGYEADSFYSYNLFDIINILLYVPIIVISIQYIRAKKKELGISLIFIITAILINEVINRTFDYQISRILIYYTILLSSIFIIKLIIEKLFLKKCN